MSWFKALSAIGALASAAVSVAGYQEKKKAAQKQKQLANQQSQIEQQRLDKKKNLLKSAQQHGYISGGVKASSGTVQAVQQDSLDEFELDEALIRLNAQSNNNYYDSIGSQANYSSGAAVVEGGVKLATIYK